MIGFLLHPPASSAACMVLLARSIDPPWFAEISATMYGLKSLPISLPLIFIVSITPYNLNDVCNGISLFFSIFLTLHLKRQRLYKNKEVL